jgi:hypothetical protein
MSIRRFDIQGWDIDFVLADDGDHVLFEDYQAEVERLREALTRIIYEYDLSSAYDRELDKAVEAAHTTLARKGGE